MDMVEMAEVLYAMHYFVLRQYRFLIASVFILIFLYIPVFLAMDITRLLWQINTDNKEIQYRVFTNLYAEYKITKNFKFKSDVGLDAIITDDKRFDENYGTNLRINNPSRLTVSTTTNMNIVWNNTLSIIKL